MTDPTAAVYVDALIGYPRTKGWRYGKSCHLFVDYETSLEVLHDFARRIGMKHEWFQVSNSGLPHYDLTAARRLVAIQNGAIEASRHKIVEVLRKHRNEH